MIAVVQTRVIKCSSADKSCLLQVVHVKAIVALTQFCDFSYVVWIGLEPLARKLWFCFIGMYLLILLQQYHIWYTLCCCWPEGVLPPKLLILVFLLFWRWTEACRIVWLLSFCFSTISWLWLYILLLCQIILKFCSHSFLFCFYLCYTVSCSICVQKMASCLSSTSASTSLAVS